MTPSQPDLPRKDMGARNKELWGIDDSNALGRADGRTLRQLAAQGRRISAAGLVEISAPCCGSMWESLLSRKFLDMEQPVRCEVQ